jgi:hypothetical protein
VGALQAPAGKGKTQLADWPLFPKPFTKCIIPKNGKAIPKKMKIRNIFASEIAKAIYCFLKWALAKK